MTRINENWRLKAKAVVRSMKDGTKVEYHSLWQASLAIAQERNCKQSTARKTISRAIKFGFTRYESTWQWK